MKKFLLLIVYFFLLFEFFSFLVSKGNLLVKNDVPGFYGSTYNKNKYKFNITEKEKWGAWRQSNKTFRQVKECFNVEFATNEIGARDSSFLNSKDDSILLIGDSFAEGYGVEIKNTVQYLIEKKINKDILNFGMSFNFGPLQEKIIYDNFRKKYDHSGIIIFVLPANDFVDNDRKYFLKSKERYRPYFSLNNDILEPYYFPESIKRGPLKQNLNLIQKIQFITTDYFWFTNVIRSIRDILYFNKKNINTGYYSNIEYQQKNFVLAHQEIVKLSDEKDVLFVLIPSRDDIETYTKTKNPHRYKNSIWFRGLDEISKKNNVFILDLLETLPGNINSLFLDCDSHWSNEGNVWASNEIYNFVSTKNIFN